MGYKDAYELHMTYMQQGFLHDAYGEHPSLKCIQEKLKVWEYQAVEHHEHYHWV